MPIHLLPIFFLKLGFLSFSLSCHSFLYVLDMSHIRWMTYKKFFLLFCGLSFHFLGQILWSTKFQSLFLSFFLFFFKGLHLQDMEVPRLGVKWELQLLAYTTATETWDPSHVCDLHHSSQQCQIPNPLKEARDQTCILTDTYKVLNPLSHGGNSTKFKSLMMFSFFHF